MSYNKQAVDVYLDKYYGVTTDEADASILDYVLTQDPLFQIYYEGFEKEYGKVSIDVNKYREAKRQDRNVQLKSLLRKLP